jgi:hypothetical protein
VQGEEASGFGYCKGLQVRIGYLVSILPGNGMLGGCMYIRGSIVGLWSRGCIRMGTCID